MNIEQAKEVLKNHFGKNHPEMSPYGSTVKKVTMVEDLYTDRFGVLKEDDPQKTEVDIVAVVCGNCDAEVQ